MADLMKATANGIRLATQATKKSRRSSTTVPVTPAAAPAQSPRSDVLQPSQVHLSQVLALHLGEHLSQEELLVARLVCKDWCRDLPAGRRSICVEQPQGYEALAHIPRIFPAADSLSFTVSERLTPDQLHFLTAAMCNSDFFRGFKHLTFITTSPPGSKSSTWPYAMPLWPLGMASMTSLESITFIGRAPQALVLTDIALICTGLTSLVLGTQPEEVLSPVTAPDIASRLVTRKACFDPISCMTSLRRLSLTLDEPSWEDHEGNTGQGYLGPATMQVKALAELKSLTELRIAGQSIGADGARSLLRSLHNLRNISLVFNGLTGKLNERGDVYLWRRLQQVELRLESLTLEAELQLLTLALPNSLRSLHLRSCTVSPYSVTALSALVALRELSFDGWFAIDEPAVLAAPPGDELNHLDREMSEAASGVRLALVELLAGPVGQQLEVLRMDLGGPSKDIFGDMRRLSMAWSQGPLRVLHLVNTSSYELTRSVAMSYLKGLHKLRELRVVVQGPPCRDGCPLRAAWLPPGLTSLELAGLDLPCIEEEDKEDKQLPQSRINTDLAGEAAEAHTKMEMQESGCGYSLRPRSRGVEAGKASAKPAGAGGPAIVSAGVEGAAAPRGGRNAGICGVDVAAAVGSRFGGSSGQAAAGGGDGRGLRSSCSGHAMLRNLQRLSLNGCRFGCCGHIKAALGPDLLSRLSSLELNDVVGLQENHLADLAALTGLTSLSVCAQGQAGIGNASLVHVSGLSSLRRLKWHVGDSLDAPPHPAILKPLRRLAVLDVSAGQWMRMSRWHVASALAETLPRCEFTTT